MAKLCVVVSFKIKSGASPDVAAGLKKMLIEDFIPVEKEAPGLISIELLERLGEPIPHYPENSASAVAFIELWEDTKSNFDWWAGDVTAPKSDRMKQAAKKFFSFMESPDGKYVEFVDSHYTVV